jgi:hypothetical protein
MNEEWIPGSQVDFTDHAIFEVLTVGDHIRTCRRMPEMDGATLWFIDCTHPLQNAICNEQYIKAWRVKSIGASAPVAIAI